VQPSLESLGPFAVVGGLATLCGLLLLLHGVRRRDGVLLGALALWLGPLAIQSGFLVTPVTDIAERLLYTPSIAACGALWLAGFRWRSRSFRVRRASAHGSTGPARPW
jgi:hypothetical protein